MSRTVTATLINNRQGTTVSFRYNLNLSGIVSSGQVVGSVEVVNYSGTTQSNITVHMGVICSDSSQVTLAGTISSLGPNARTTCTVRANLTAGQASGGTFSWNGHIYAYGNSLSSENPMIRQIRYNLSFTIPTAGDKITHSDLAQFTRFLTLYGGAHTTNASQINANESQYPQGRQGGYSIVTGGFSTTGAYGGYAPGDRITIGYVEGPYSAYSSRSGT